MVKHEPGSLKLDLGGLVRILPPQLFLTFKDPEFIQKIDRPFTRKGKLVQSLSVFSRSNPHSNHSRDLFGFGARLLIKRYWGIYG